MTTKPTQSALVIEPKENGFLVIATGRPSLYDVSQAHIVSTHKEYVFDSTVALFNFIDNFYFPREGME